MSIALLFFSSCGHMHATVRAAAGGALHAQQRLRDRLPVPGGRGRQHDVPGAGPRGGTVR